MTRPTARTAAAIIATAGLGLLAGACGGSAGSQPAASAQQNGALAFARCMRSHGVPNWPDPNRSGMFDKTELRQLAIGPSRLRAIEDGACNHLLPSGGGGPQETAQQRRTRVAAALSFASCIRARGYPSFPDPTNQGDLTPQMVTAAGIDLHQPALLRAGLACVSVTHGLLTRASVERAVHGR